MDTLRGDLTITSTHVMFHAEPEDCDDFPPAIAGTMRDCAATRIYIYIFFWLPHLF